MARQFYLKYWRVLTRTCVSHTWQWHRLQRVWDTHFIWKCLIYSPLSEFSLTISSLVNNSCHLVLIRLDVVEKLGLNILSLETPELINVAIKDCKRKKKLKLNKFVISSATSSDHYWSSKWVQGLITPNLCMSVIFRLPFLTHNNIVTNHALFHVLIKKLVTT